jgi:hypothetical protein
LLLIEKRNRADTLAELMLVNRNRARFRSFLDLNVAGWRRNPLSIFDVLFRKPAR